MKVRLMDPAHDFDPDAAEPAGSDDVRRDLELDMLWDAMAAGDRYLRGVARAAILTPATDVAVIRYRQDAYADVCASPDAVARLYALAVDAVQIPRGIWMMAVRGRPEASLLHAVRMLTALADRLERLFQLGRQESAAFGSAAFRALFAAIAAELDPAYLRELRGRLKELEFGPGMMLSARLGHDGQVVGQVLRQPRPENRRLLDRTPLKKPFFSFTIPERDEAGFAALGERRERSVADVALAATQSVDHVRGFFRTLRAELGFYLAARNLEQALLALGVRTVRPQVEADGTTLAAGLCDPCLALRSGSAPIGNDLALREGRLLVITGANHGGKSTFLRSLGTAQLMAQAGMPVAARALRMPVTGRVLTHWTREEDEHLAHGKFDDELERMSAVVDRARPGDLLLCNESFSSTNEAEGSQIAADVTAALVSAGIRVRFVTHLYDFARAVQEAGLQPEYLRAPREAGGIRTYRLEAGPPLPTSFGVDLYDRAFGTHLARD